MKLESICTAKEIIRQKDNPGNERKYLHMTDESLIYKIHKKTAHLRLNANKQPNQKILT